jgi:hypothetical protein
MAGLEVAGVEIRGRPVVQDHHFLVKDILVLTEGSPSNNLILAVIKSSL